MSCPPDHGKRWKQTYLPLRKSSTKPLLNILEVSVLPRTKKQVSDWQNKGPLYDRAFQTLYSQTTDTNLPQKNTRNLHINGCLTITPPSQGIQSNGKVESALKTAKKLLHQAVSSAWDPLSFLAHSWHTGIPITGVPNSPSQPPMEQRTKTLLQWGEICCSQKDGEKGGTRVWQVNQGCTSHGERHSCEDPAIEETPEGLN